LLAVVRDLEQMTGTALQPTLLFEYTTISELAAYLSEIVPPAYEQNLFSAAGEVAAETELPDAGYREAAAGEDSEAPEAVRRTQAEDIAVIGMAGRFPGADNVQEFWANLVAGKDCITEIPLSRWDWKQYQGVTSPTGKKISRWGGFINNPDFFDPHFFRISPREAEVMDPQERLFLEICWEAIEDAGYTPKTLVPPKGPNRRRPVGVFVGAMHKDYAMIGSEAFAKGQLFSLSLQNAPIANRVSYFCNFHGPSMAVDTLCSSSMTALHLALESIHNGECEVAIAGGVNLSLHPNKYLSYGMLDFFSSDGHCHTFGKGGDGYVPGEGIGAVILKPLSKAIQDGDSIYAVIKGSTVNHVGTVSGITVPSPVAQAELIQECLEKAKIDPRTISYVEAHGTGTSLGDPIEIEGLVKAIRQYTQDVQFCSIGSVKSNIGHTESAAGITGLIKVILQLHHKILVPSLHSEELNPLIDFDKTPFYVQRQTEYWKQPEIVVQGSVVQVPRRAAVSSFGATGSNAHVILEEYVPQQKSNDPRTVLEGQPAIIPLSAKSSEQLVEYAGRLLRYLKRAAGQTSPASGKASEDAEIRSELEGKLRALVSEVVNVEEDAVETNQEWSEFGIDLVQLAKIRDRLQDEYRGQIELELDAGSSIASVVECIIQAQRREGNPDHASVAVQSPARSVAEWNLMDVNLHELAYTLQVGREAMEERLLFIAKSIPDLINKLELYLQNPAECKDCYQGQVKRNKDFIHVLMKDEDSLDMIRKWIIKGKLGALADLWVKGYQMDWNLLYGPVKPRRIHLPTYPFAKERYWITTDSKRAPLYPASVGNATVVLHPLLHRNTSDLSEQRYSSVFTGEEFFLSDHVVNGQRILPGLAHLEMARAAVELATGGQAAGDIGKQQVLWKLNNVVWIRPLIVEGDSLEVHIRLQPEDDGEIAFEIYSGSDGNEIVYSQGKAIPSPVAKPSAVDLARLQAECGKGNLASEQCYQAFSRMGMEYGAGQRGIQVVYTGENQALAKLSLPYHLHSTKNAYVLHPSILDSALQATIGVTYGAGESALESLKPTLPFALQEIVTYAPCPAEAWVYLRFSQGGQAGDPVQKFDIDLCNEQGEIFASIKGFTIRVLDGTPRLGGAPKAVAAEAVNRPPVGAVSLYPVWNVIPDAKGPQLPAADEQVVIIGGSESNISAIRRMYPHANAITFDAGDDINSMVSKFSSLPSIDHIIWIAPALSAAPTDDAMIHGQAEGFYQLFRAIKAVLQLGYGKKKLGWSVWTVRSQMVRSADAVNSMHAGIYGLMGSLAKEYPKWSVRLVDLEDDQDVPVDELFLLPVDRQGRAWAYRDRQWYQQQLIQLECPSFNRTAYRHGGVYVVIGGAGSVGEMWSEYMIRKYQARIIWIGRRKKDAAIKAKLDRLAAFGPAPRYISADAGNFESLRRAYEEIKQVDSHIHGIVHSTMVLLDQSLERMEEEDLRNVLASKVDTCVRMAQVFQQESLDFVLFFSSLMAFTKAPNQSSYASGCTFEDAFARQLSQVWPCKVKVMNWGYWGKSDGEANDSESHQALAETYTRLAEIGIGLIQPAEAMEEIEKLLAGPADQMGFMKTTKPIFIEAVNPDEKAVMNERGEVIRQLIRPNAASFQPPKQEPAVKQYSGNTSGQLREKTTAFLKKLVGDTLKMSVHKIDASEPLETYGIDSIIIVQLTNALRDVFGEIPSTLFFECQTIDELAGYFMKSRKDALIEFFGTGDSSSDHETDAGPQQPAVQQPPAIPSVSIKKSRRFAQALESGGTEASSRTSFVQDVAIIGLAGRYPQAKNLNEFWENLAAGRNCITEIPEDRWDWKKYYNPERGREGSIYTKWGGFLEDIDQFDPLFFNITPREAKVMDPQERLFMEVAYASIEDAGYTPAALSERRKVGVFVGVMNSNYPSGTAYWSIANRLSYCLNFRGPSMAVDTACSSSLTALHLALESIYSGTSEVAIAGGVNLIVDPFHYIRLTSQSMLSPGNRCNAFGDQADGFVDSEGVGAVVLKPLQKAIEDGDHIYGIIKGSMINSGGKTNGYTVPNPSAQSQVVAEALQRAGVHARTISYVEAHGTGTALGDPIEIEGLRQAFELHTSDKQYCAIGSVKSNIGHGESAAGIAGLTKVLLQLKHGYLVPSLHSETLNPRIPFANTPFTVQRELVPWVRPVVEIDGQTKEYPRIAGLSSFGAGGSNAHVIIEEYIPDPAHSSATATVQPPYLIVLSAKTENQLKEQAKQLLDALRNNAYSDEDLASIAYTLQVGREAMEERLGLVVETVKELEEKLQGYLDQREDVENVYQGQVKRNKEALHYFTTDEDLMEAVDKWIVGRKYTKLIDLWVKGLPVDWNKLYRNGKPRRISLPTYPFAKARYWLAPGEFGAPSDRPAANDVRPLLPQPNDVLAGHLAGSSKRWEKEGTTKNCWNYALWNGRI
jgi:acyl transferase domain-containing protein/acyl carrier protein